MSIVSQCLSFSLLLAATSITDIRIPLNYDIDLGNTTIGLKSIQCPIVNGGNTGIYYNSTGASIEVFEPMNITCEIEVDVNGTKASDLIFALTSKAGEALTIATIPDPEMPCYSANATLTASTLAPEVSDLRFDPPDGSLNFLLGIIQLFINGEIKNGLTKLGTDVATQIVNKTELPLNPFPPLRMGALPIQKWGLATLISNIVGKLPYELFGAHIDVAEPSTTGLELNVSMQKSINITTETLSIYTPPHVTLSADLGVDMLICNDEGLVCTIANGFKLPNIRTWGGGQMDRLMNNYISPMLTNIVDGLFANGVALAIPAEEPEESPPQWVLVFLGPVLAIFAVMAVGYSVHRHVQHPINDIHGKPISIKRVIVEDMFVTAMCFVCIYLFIWSNCTTAASMVIGDEITVYTFSLVNSVRDMWEAGLYPLSLLIALFSGVYPYIKLITIVTFSVVLQQPQNKFLRLVDNIGKFSLLDSFVMTILKTGLEINGIATVKCHFSFYVFVFATLGSIFVGNFATHGWRRQTQIRYNDDERELVIQRVSQISRMSVANPKERESFNPSAHIGIGFAANDYNEPLDASSSSSAGKSANKKKSGLTDSAVNRVLVSDKGLEGIDALNLRWYHVWEWRLALPLGAVVGVLSALACYYPNLTFHITGFATILTGTEKPSSLWQLFIACDPILLTVGLITVVFAPFVYVVTYPHCRFMAAWGATDVFLLSCVAGLLQLKQFIAFTLGEGMDGLYSASCSLEWPLLLLTISVFVQWFFVFKQTLGIPGMPTPTKIRLALALRDELSSGENSEADISKA